MRRTEFAKCKIVSENHDASREIDLLSDASPFPIRAIVIYSNELNEGKLFPTKGNRAVFPKYPKKNMAPVICGYCCFIAETGIVSYPRLMISHDRPIGSRVHQKLLQNYQVK